MSEKENPCSIPDEAQDYELAKRIAQYENGEAAAMEQQVSPFKELDEQVVKDHMTAQMLERQELEALKYQEWSKDAENASDMKPRQSKKAKMSWNYDPNMTPEEELEWLKNKYGMTDLDSLTKAEQNLERAFKSKRIDQKTYNEEKAAMKSELDGVFDNGKTRSVDVIPVLQSMNAPRWMERRYLCTHVEHYGTGLLDGGYGCGYRNTQMLLSSIRADPKLRDTLFNNNNLSMPSVRKLQSLIERAWNLGFDAIGKEQFNGTLVNTVKWIGASDIAALFLSLRIRVELVDIYEPKNGEPISNDLFNYVRNYFENSRGHVHPIYIQHQGHSRTIVGIEIGKNQSMNLIIFDPGTRATQIENFKNEPFRFMHIFRRGANGFKHKQYQLLVLRGLIESDVEYENSKVLKSARLNY